MISSLVRKVVGSKNERYLKTIDPLVAQVNGLEPKMQALSDEQIAEQITAWRQEVENGRDLDDLLPECFALVREASVRVLEMRHFDVQIMGGVVLHQGKIAEMKTGEGKTLVATLPVALNALTGKGVHVVTVNDYLASRDAEWMGRLYQFLGFSTGVIVHGLNEAERKEAYGADITYGTNNEFGFDYLRDNMKFYKENLVQREHYFAIVDEVDSILIDEARTPLIISGPTQVTTGMYTQLNQLVPKLKRSTAEEGEVDDGHYTLDEKSRSVTLTDEGVAHVEQLLGLDNLYDPANISFQHHLLQALKAHRLFKKDVDYVVKDGQVVIVDEFTGRLMPGRRYSDGLHQALEAKENVKVAAENQTYASITFQNYFRMYDKLAGMTGTADTEAVEFREIYGLDVAAIPTHRPMVRTDFPDAIYRGQNEKHQAIVNDIAQLHKDGQPVLVGTISIEKSEMLSKMLTKKRVPHNVLNAKNHGKEAEIIAEAGHKGKVTIATNMAGRGTDIKLGEGVIDLGGLHILGTERHESRRIDNQLRGRAGRQGDPGSSRFYLALDDDLLRLFGSDRVAGLMSRLGMEEGQAIENKLVSRAIEGAQRRVENQHFDVRKQLLDYDNVMSQQREVVYDLRRDIMIKPDLTELLDEYIEDLLDEIYFNAPENFDKMDEEERHALIVRLDEVFALSRVLNLEGTVPLQDQAKEKVEEIFAILKGDAEKHYMEIVRYFMLEALDRNWKDHLLQMDQLREGIGLRGYGQRDPKQEYKREGFRIFQEMLYTTKENAMKHLCRLKVQKDRAETQEFKHKEQPANLNYAAGRGQAGKKKAPVKRAEPKVGRNDPCPCGSGKKFKKCCGAGQ